MALAGDGRTAADLALGELADARHPRDRLVVAVEQLPPEVIML
jgi:hypothetical protein